LETFLFNQPPTRLANDDHDFFRSFAHRFLTSSRIIRDRTSSLALAERARRRGERLT